jgi:sec-independent protein translocase protein TatC
VSVIRPIGHEDRLSLVEHLDELRTRLIASLVVVGIVFGFTYWQNHRILHIVNKPLASAQQVGKHGSRDTLSGAAQFDVGVGRVFKKLGPALQADARAQSAVAADGAISPATRQALAESSRQLHALAPLVRQAAAAAPQRINRQPITFGVAEPFVTTFTVAGYAALLLSLPFILYQAYAFVLPAFSPRERRVAVPLMLTVPALFVAGVVFGYFVALPRAVGFLQNFNSSSFDILIRAQDYYKFAVVVLGLLGLLFQIPVGVLVLTRLGVVTPRQLAKNRGYVILAISIIAAVATPTPDPVTMLVTMAPMVVLFELSVVLARIFRPRGGSLAERWAAVDDGSSLS